MSLALGGWLYFASRDLEQRLIDEALSAELEDYLARLARNPRSLPPETATIRGYLVRPSQGLVAPGDPTPLELNDLPPGRYTLEVDGVSYRVAVHQGPDATLYMLHSRAQLALREQRLALMLILGMTLTTLLSAAGGWWLAGRVTAPVRTLAERVRGRDPTDPVPPEPPDLPDDEVGELARTIDGYLRRLRAFVERERTFVSSVSHELRTPLAVIQGAVEVLESDPGLDGRTRERVGRISRAARGMADLTTALLVLAREGQGQTSPPTPCAVDEVLAECVETAPASAASQAGHPGVPDRGASSTDCRPPPALHCAGQPAAQRLHLHGAGPGQGDPDRVRGPNRRYRPRNPARGHGLPVRAGLALPAHRARRGDRAAFGQAHRRWPGLADHGGEPRWSGGQLPATVCAGAPCRPAGIAPQPNGQSYCLQ